MTEPLDVKARLKAKGLDNTGVTEEIARQMANRLGSSTMLIVEVRHDELVTHADGTRQVKLAVTAVEPVPEAVEDTVREFQRALYRTRPEVGGQAVLKGTADGASVDDAARDLSAQVQKDEDGNVVSLWKGDVPPDPGFVYCPSPGCDLEDGHDGDHNADTSDEDPEAASD